MDRCATRGGADPVLRAGWMLMGALRWVDCDRNRLGDLLPEALVILPVGAVEQHGPHLPTGTDSFIVTAVVAAAAGHAAAKARRDLVLAPTLCFGASDHHFPFGATLSLSTETVTAVLLDLARSVDAAGGRRLMIVNGHGGNRGPCHSAAASAATRYGLSVGYLDYWELLLPGAEPDDDPPGPAPDEVQTWAPVPGHAGVFETSLIAHLRPHLVNGAPARIRPPRITDVPTVTRHDPEIWRRLDGFTDNPARADAAAGERWFADAVARLVGRMVALAEDL